MSRSEIKSGKDLKGKRIGVDSVAGTTEYVSRVAVEHFGSCEPIWMILKKSKGMTWQRSTDLRFTGADEAYG